LSNLAFTDAPSVPMEEPSRTPAFGPAGAGASGATDIDHAVPATTEASATTGTADHSAAWPERQAVLLPPPPQLPPVSDATAAGGGKIPLEARAVLAAVYCYKTWLAGHPVRASDMLREVPEFRDVYTAPNALGTLLGKGVAGHGFGLFRRGDAYPASYVNGWQLARRLTAEQLEKVARLLGFDGVEALTAAVRDLPESPA
jgi:hypothetical protein